MSTNRPKTDSYASTTHHCEWYLAGSRCFIEPYRDQWSEHVLRVIAQTNIPGSTQPTGAFDAIGLGGQFGSSNPFNSGYQLFPMKTQDIIPVIVTQPTVEFQLAGGSVNSQGPGASSMRVNIVNPVNRATTVKIRVNNIAPTVYG